MSAAAKPPAWLGAPAAAVPWPELRVVVCGLGISGTAAVDVLLQAGATVEVVDAATGDVAQSRAAALTRRGAVVRLGDADPDIGRPDLVITSPGWAPDNPVLRRAAGAGVPIWGEVELAWRFNPPATRWLAITGTNGKTTTTEMLAAMLAAARIHSVAAGNIGTALLDAVRAEPPYDLLAVELSSFQLHWSLSLHPVAAALLNIAPDHLDWHGSLAAYAADKAAVFAQMGAGDIAVGNADDPLTREIVHAAPAGRTVEFTLGVPQPGQLGVEDGWLVDRAYGGDGMLPVARMRGVVGRHNVANALAALAVALGAGVEKAACLAALTHFTPGAHRLATILVHDGVSYVDDSKATNPHAAAQALAAFDRVVWIAGGLNKGLEFDELVASGRERLVAAVLIGSCADEIAAALARHAPEIPVRRADSMHTAVEAAAGIAQDGDTVLLAPAAASMDMFRDYRERGDAFRIAAEGLTGRKDDSAE